jgi:hypothetical protein
MFAAVTVDILDASVVDVPTAILAAAAFLALTHWHRKLTVVAVVLSCGIAGLVLQAVGAVLAASGRSPRPGYWRLMPPAFGSAHPPVSRRLRASER